jgi:acyl-CoA thioester hydrolase
VAGRALSVPLRVRYVECDMQGHVFNAHYLTWFDLAHTELLREAGFPGSFEREAVDVVVAEAQVRYRSPARFDEQLEVVVAPEPLGHTSMTTRFVVERAGRALAEGMTRHVCVNAGELTPRPWPAWLPDRLAPFVRARPGPDPHGPAADR